MKVWLLTLFREVEALLSLIMQIDGAPPLRNLQKMEYEINVFTLIQEL